MTLSTASSALFAGGSLPVPLGHGRFKAVKDAVNWPTRRRRDPVHGPPHAGPLERFKGARVYWSVGHVHLDWPVGEGA